MGREAGRLLLARLAQPDTPFQVIKLSPELVERQSTGVSECDSVGSSTAVAVATV